MYATIGLFVVLSALAMVSPIGFAGVMVSATCFGVGYQVAQLCLPSLRDEE